MSGVDNLVEKYEKVKKELNKAEKKKMQLETKEEQLKENIKKKKDEIEEKYGVRELDDMAEIINNKKEMMEELLPELEEKLNLYEDGNND